MTSSGSFKERRYKILYDKFVYCIVTGHRSEKMWLRKGCDADVISAGQPTGWIRSEDSELIITARAYVIEQEEIVSSPGRSSAIIRFFNVSPIKDVATLRS